MPLQIPVSSEPPLCFIVWGIIQGFLFISVGIDVLPMLSFEILVL